MPAVDRKDMAGGALLVVIGLSAAAYAYMTLNLGTINRMGPGMAPVTLGLILAAMGLGIMATAFGRAGGFPAFDLRSFVAVGLSILVFGLLVGPFGLVPAIFGLTAVASRADSRLSPLGVLAVATGMAVVAVLVFRIGLNLHVAVFSWPW